METAGEYELAAYITALASRGEIDIPVSIK